VFVGGSSCDRVLLSLGVAIFCLVATSLLGRVVPT